jgi:hypothetical protein
MEDKERARNNGIWEWIGSSGETRWNVEVKAMLSYYVGTYFIDFGPSLFISLLVF